MDRRHLLRSLLVFIAGLLVPLWPRRTPQDVCWGSDVATPRAIEETLDLVFVYSPSRRLWVHSTPLSAPLLERELRATPAGLRCFWVGAGEDLLSAFDAAERARLGVRL